ncbi:MAG: hypothetical protein H6Q90_4003 [Deltaproteobacteria bacterium]|nr:hypothetical protein [Deltaproteobacteria bacterium]
MNRRASGLLLVASVFVALDVVWGAALPKALPWLLAHRDPDALDGLFWWIGLVGLMLDVAIGGLLTLGMALAARGPLVRRRALLASVLAGASVAFIGLRMVLLYLLDNRYSIGSSTDWVLRLHSLAQLLLRGACLFVVARTLRAVTSDPRIRAATTAMGVLVLIGLALPLWSSFVADVSAPGRFPINRFAVAALFLVVVAMLRRGEVTA